jgi:hypothetical protein
MCDMTAHNDCSGNGENEYVRLSKVNRLANLIFGGNSTATKVNFHFVLCFTFPPLISSCPRNIFLSSIKLSLV